MKFFYDEQADLAHLADNTIGFGNQCRAQRLNLRDSNLQVIVSTQRDDTCTKPI